MVVKQQAGVTETAGMCLCATAFARLLPRNLLPQNLPVCLWDSCSTPSLEPISFFSGHSQCSSSLSLHQPSVTGRRPQARVRFCTAPILRPADSAHGSLCSRQGPLYLTSDLYPGVTNFTQMLYAQVRNKCCRLSAFQRIMYEY